MRIATFEISSNFLVDLLREGRTISDFDERIKIAEGVPATGVLRDIKYVDSGGPSGTFLLLLEDESFPELGDGDAIWSTTPKMISYEVETRPIDEN